MTKIKENIIYIIISISIIILFAIIIFSLYNLHKNDNVYMYLKGENDRVRSSVEIYYLTQDEKNTIYKELDNIEMSIAKKEDPITTDNMIREIHNKLITMENNNIKNKVNVES